MGHCGCVGEMEGEEMGGCLGVRKGLKGFTSILPHSDSMHSK